VKQLHKKYEPEQVKEFLEKYERGRIKRKAFRGSSRDKQSTFFQNIERDYR
jgi:hypothetical protein